MAEPADPPKPVEKELSGRIGKYEILRPLGKGAMGQVYLARDTMLDRDVALKVMVAQIADDPELKARFEREAKAVAKMTHPNVVIVFDLGNHSDGSPFIAMELLKGLDLQKAVRQTPPLTLERKVAVIVQVLAGLAHAHQAGIVHRDIKPANIFIQDDGSVKIMDFGVAHVTAASMTGTGSVVGTADYMSPEQVQGKKVDGRSDLFSVGCMLFELASGRRPFHSDNLMAIFYKITHEDANFDLIPQGADYDALMPVLKKALSKTLDDRYQTAYEFAVDLREWLKAHATTTSSQNVLEALVDLEAPTHAPVAMTEPGVSEGGATVDLGPGRRPTVARRPTLAPTRAGGKTVLDAGPTARPAPARPSVSQRIPARVQPAPKASVLPWVAMGLALVAVGVAGFLALKSQQAPPAPVVMTPSTTAPPPTTLATPAPPPVTAAPAPQFGEAGGKAAASVKAAQTAFEAGNYDKAVASAQSALREDAASEPAKKILAQAMIGQKAADQVRSGDGALARGDFAAAETAAAEALPDRAVGQGRGRPAAPDRRVQGGGPARRRRQGRECAHRPGDDGAQRRRDRAAGQAVRSGDRRLRPCAPARPRQLCGTERPDRRDQRQGHRRCPGVGSAPRRRVRQDLRARSHRGEGGERGRPRGLRGFGGCRRQEGHAGRRPARHDRVRGDAAGAEGGRGLQGRRLPLERRHPADPARADDELVHDRRRPLPEGAGRSHRPRRWLPARGASCGRCLREWCGRTARSRG